MKNRYTFFIFLLLILACDRPVNKSIVSQQNDSLAYFFERANNDSVPYDERQLYTRKAIAVISKDPNDSMNRVNYFKVANRYYNMRQLENQKSLEDYKRITLAIVGKAIEAKDTLSLIKAYGYMSDYYIEKKIPDSNYIYNNKVEKLYSLQKDHINVIKTLLRKSIMQHNEGDFFGCERTVFDILKESKYVNDDEIMYEAHNLLGIVYGELSEFRLSQRYYELAIRIVENGKIPSEYHLKAMTLNNLGLLYRYQNKDLEAINYFKEGLKEKNLLKDRPRFFATLMDNLAYSKFKAGDYIELPELFHKALKIRDSVNFVPGIIINNTHLSEYHAFKNDTLKAIRYAKKAYTLSHENNLKRDVLFSLKQLISIDPANAAKYTSEYFRISDSLQTVERKNRNKFARVEFETDELAVEKDRLARQKGVLIYISIGIVLLAAVVFIIRYQISRNRELKLLQEKQKANEEIYQLMLDHQQKVEEGRQLEKKRISRELHDGVMGRLSGIRLNLFVLGRKTDPDTISKSLGHIGEIQEIEKEIRSIAYDLERNVFSDTAGFVGIVEDLFRNAEKHSDIGFVSEVDDAIGWDELGANHKINLYRIFQESLQNIVKYAQANKIVLKINRKGDGLSVSIEDDGIGFDIHKIRKGLGLKNMQERVEEMDGTMEIRSEEGKGTKINLLIPI